MSDEPLAGEAGRGPGTEQASAGRLVARLREDAGIHVAALAATLKVPVRKLEALEADRYEAFPDVVFLRALASSVCRVLKVDPAPVLALLPHAVPRKLAEPSGTQASFRGAGVGVLAEKSRPRVVGPVVLALLLAALVVVFWPRGGDRDAERSSSESPPVAAAAVPADGDAAPQAGAVPVGEPAPAREADAPVPEKVVPESGALAPAARAPDPQSALVIQARQQTWVQVRDGRGTVLVQKNLEAGERFAAADAAPWFVVIGRADAADVTVRGEPMDLAAIARSNVARFEVK